MLFPLAKMSFPLPSHNSPSNQILLSFPGSDQTSAPKSPGHLTPSIPKAAPVTALLALSQVGGGSVLSALLTGACGQAPDLVLSDSRAV